MPEGAISESENRRHRRVPSKLRCWCEGQNVTVYARVGNLSEGGLFVRTSTPMPAGSRAVVRLKDGDVGEVSAPVRVVWAREGTGDHPAGMGLMFDGVEEQVVEAIRRIVSSELKRSAD